MKKALPKVKSRMFTAQVVETSVTVNNNSPIQDYVHPDDQTQPLNFINVLVIQWYAVRWFSRSYVTRYFKYGITDSNLLSLVETNES